MCRRIGIASTTVVILNAMIPSCNTTESVARMVVEQISGQWPVNRPRDHVGPRVADNAQERLKAKLRNQNALQRNADRASAGTSPV